MKWLVHRVTGVDRVVGTHYRGALVAPGVCFVALEVQSMVLSGAEQGVEPSSTHMSLMTWQAM